MKQGYAKNKSMEAEKHTAWWDKKDPTKFEKSARSTKKSTAKAVLFEVSILKNQRLENWEARRAA